MNLDALASIDKKTEELLQDEGARKSALAAAPWVVGTLTTVVSDSSDLGRVASTGASALATTHPEAVTKVALRARANVTQELEALSTIFIQLPFGLCYSAWEALKELFS